MMKPTMLLSTLLLTGVAFGETLKLKSFDEAKLGELLDRLPAQMTERVQEHNFRRNLKIVTLSFPQTPAAFSMKCARHFYQDAPYPSETHCEVTVDKHHPQAILRNDVVRVTMQDPSLVKGIYQAIPYSAVQRKFYSYHRNQGITFQGVKGTVHHYQIICSSKTCWFKFSNKILVE